MNPPQKVLVLGATGAMGKYLVPKLLERGYAVDAVALDEISITAPNLRGIKGNALEWELLDKLWENRYDGIVDFMKYPTADAYLYLPEMLKHTGHYIYLSSYRVYDNKEIPIRETSPRLLDTADDPLLRSSDDYCVYKARGENILLTSGRKNWTAVRPAITYSLGRYQLVTLEARSTVGRAMQGKSVVLPEQAAEIPATMSWAGDVAEMIARLLFNPRALGEIYTVSTAEHHTWREIAEYYHDICSLNAVWVDKEEYLAIVTSRPHFPGNRWQLDYDRLFSRIMDNRKVLEATGLRQSDLTSLYDGLQYEIGRFVLPEAWRGTDGPMDRYLAAHGMK